MCTLIGSPPILKRLTIPHGNTKKISWKAILHTIARYVETQILTETNEFLSR